MIEQLQRYGLYLLGLLVTTSLIWYWNRGAQRRRFNRHFPKTAQANWSTEDEAFLKAIEHTFRLRRTWAKRLPPETTPMQLYLTLYPEHCIYDASELTRFTSAWTQHVQQSPSQDLLTLPLQTLAKHWQASSKGTV